MASAAQPAGFTGPPPLSSKKPELGEVRTNGAPVRTNSAMVRANPPTVYKNAAGDRTNEESVRANGYPVRANHGMVFANGATVCTNDFHAALLTWSPCENHSQQIVDVDLRCAVASAGNVRWTTTHRGAWTPTHNDGEQIIDTNDTIATGRCNVWTSIDGEG